VPILPEHIWAKIPPKTATGVYTNTPPVVGSGPFQCVQWKKSDYLVMQANKSYWRGAPHVDEIVFEEYTNADTMGEDMKSGAIDGCLGLLQAQMHELAHAKGVQVRAVHVNGYDELGFNCYTGGPSLGNPVLKDWRFRQALQWAVDKNKLCAIAYGGMAKPADTVITANYYRSPDWHWTPPADQAYSFNLTKAGADADGRGLPLVNGVRLNKQGKPISLRVYARSSSPESITCGEFITGWLRQLGLKIVLSTLDDGALESDLYNTVKGTFTPNYDMFLWGWYNDIDPGRRSATSRPPRSTTGATAPGPTRSTTPPGRRRSRDGPGQAPGARAQDASRSSISSRPTSRSPTPTTPRPGTRRAGPAGCRCRPRWATSSFRPTAMRPTSRCGP
jgi:peptide/nickel transport system substrate-binding protein